MHASQATAAETPAAASGRTARSVASAHVHRPRELAAARTAVRFLLRTAIVLLAAILLVRAALFLVYCGLSLLSPVQAYYLEGVNVHLAWRVQHGMLLYPDSGHGDSLVANFMGPCYFVLIGALGNLFSADIPGLYVLGRSTTILCRVAGALAVGAYLSKRHGRLAALVGAAAALGSGPMIGFGIMARPDMLADLLGFAGFLLCWRRGRTDLVIAGAALSLCILTKQTAGLYLVAAALALWCEARRKEAVLLSTAVSGTVVGVLSLLAATWEPNIVDHFFAQAHIPFSWDQYQLILLRLLKRSPDVICFAILGAWVPLGTRPIDDRRMRILLAVMLAGALVASSKLGSDLNYFLSIRLLAGICAGSLCHAALTARREEQKWLPALVAAIVLCVPGLGVMTSETAEALRLFHAPASVDSAAAPRFRLYDSSCLALASDPKASILTDFDQLAAYQRGRAPFLDAYLLRLRAKAGHVALDGVISQVEARSYDYVILALDVNSPSYDQYFWRLPSPLADVIRENYRLAERRNGFFVYTPAERAESRS